MSLQSYAISGPHDKETTPMPTEPTDRPCQFPPLLPNRIDIRRRIATGEYASRSDMWAPIGSDGKSWVMDYGTDRYGRLFAAAAGGVDPVPPLVPVRDEAAA